MIDKLVEWLESHLRPCAFREQTGVYCAGCGLQRSIIALLKGNIIESITLYPALIPILLMFIFLFLHLIFRFRSGAAILKYLFIGNASIIFMHYIYILFL